MIKIRHIKVLYLLVILLITNFSYSQEYNVNIRFSYWTDTINNKDLIPIVKLYKNYLESRPDSLYDNPYWNKKEKQIFKYYDFSSNVIFHPDSWTAKSLYGNFIVYLLKIEKKDSIFIIQSILIGDKLSDEWIKFNPVAITRIAAIPEGKSYKLANAYTYDVKDWHLKNSKYIVYHYPLDTYYSDSLNLLNNQFCDNLIKRFGFKKPSMIELYSVDGVHEVGKLLGYDYYIYGNADGKSLNNITEVSHFCNS
jgi:hypothetical protein